MKILKYCSTIIKVKNMSFNLASLIAGTPSISNSLIPNKSDIKPSEKVQNVFTHGSNIIFTNGTYKGYHSTVTGFFPASISLMTSGKAYIEADKYGRLAEPGHSLITEVGNSLIEQVIPYTGGKNVAIQLFKMRGDNQLRVGLVMTNVNLIINSLVKQGKNINDVRTSMENRNNHFLMELSMFDESLINNMTNMNINGDINNLISQLTNMQINSEIPAPLEQLSEEVKTNHELLDKITNPEHFESDIKISIVFKKDLVGPQYYLNVSNKLGKIKMYNPNKSHYLVSYTKAVEFIPSIVKIEKEPLANGEVAFQLQQQQGDLMFDEKREVKMTNLQIQNNAIQRFKYFGLVKSGPYSGQRLEVVNNKLAHLEVMLSSTGRKIKSHVVRKLSTNGDYIIDNYDNPIFESSMILPSHIFYIDVLLKNGNYAQVNKILPDGRITVIEKDTQTLKYVKTTITKDDITKTQPGFKFNEKNIFVEDKYPEEFLAEPMNEEEDKEQVDDSDENKESQEIDYDDNINDNDEVEVRDKDDSKASFKDTQRTSLDDRKLTEYEKTLKTNIVNILKALKMNDESIDIYKMIDNIKSFIVNIQNKLKVINYTYNLSSTNDVKFIYVCLVLYELIKNGFSKDLNEVVTMLFPQYFSVKDIKANAMNDSIFFKKWSDNLSQDSINESVSKIRQFRLKDSDYPKIIKEILINADKILQGMLNHNINIIKRNSADIKDLFPVGVNSLTGRRYRDEEQEAELAKRREVSNTMRSQILTVEDILSNKPLVAVEIPIVWTENNIQIIETFKHELQVKANKQGENLKQGYMYMINNLKRAPFAIRDDIMTAEVRKAFVIIYKTLISTIIKQNLKLEKGKKRFRDEQEQVNIRREEILSKKPKQDEDDEDIVQLLDTPAFLKEKLKRETQSMLTRTIKAANRGAYLSKKQRASVENEEKST